MDKMEDLVQKLKSSSTDKEITKALDSIKSTCMFHPDRLFCLVQYNAINILVSFLDHPKFCDHALSIIADGCTMRKFSEQLLHKNGFYPIVRIMKSDICASIKHRACRAIGNIAKTLKGPEALCLGTGVVEKCVEFLSETKNVECNITALRTLKYLVMISSPIKIEVANDDGIFNISSFLLSPDMRLQIFSTELIAHLTFKCLPFCLKFINLRILKEIVELHSHNDFSVQFNVLLILKNVSVYSEMRIGLVQAGAVNVFATVLSNFDDYEETYSNYKSIFKMSENAANALCSCLDYLHLWPKYGTEKEVGLKALLDVLRNEKFEGIHNCVIKSLFPLSYEKSNSLILLKLNALTVLIKIVKLFTLKHKCTVPSEDKYNINCGCMDKVYCRCAFYNRNLLPYGVCHHCSLSKGRISACHQHGNDPKNCDEDEFFLTADPTLPLFPLNIPNANAYTYSSDDEPDENSSSPPEESSFSANNIHTSEIIRVDNRIPCSKEQELEIVRRHFSKLRKKSSSYLSSKKKKLNDDDDDDDYKNIIAITFPARWSETRERLDHFALTLMRLLSFHLDVQSNYQPMAEKKFYSVLIDYLCLIHYPSHAAKLILKKLITERNCFEKLISNGFISELEKMLTNYCRHRNCVKLTYKSILQQGRKDANSDFIVGTLSHMMASSNKILQVNSIHAALKLLTSHSLRKVFFYDGLSLLLSLISSDNDSSHIREKAIVLICELYQSFAPQEILSSSPGRQFGHPMGLCSYDPVVLSFEGLKYDVTFYVDDRVLKANRAKLCANSEYFRALLSGYFAESKRDTINFFSTSADSLEIIFHLLHGCGAACCPFIKNITLHQALQVLLKCDQFLMSEGKIEMEYQLKTLLQPSTATDIFIQSKVADVPTLAQEAVLCILNMKTEMKDDLLKHFQEMMNVESQFFQEIRNIFESF